MDYAWIETPIGRLLLISDENGLHRIDFANGSSRPDPAWHESLDALKETIRQLRAYFARELEEFEVPLAPEGTPFRKNVWRHLCEIPYGETISYAVFCLKKKTPSAQTERRSCHATHVRVPLRSRDSPASLHHRV